MRRTARWIAIALCAACGGANAQPGLQEEMDQARQAAARGESTSVVIRAGANSAANVASGVYVFYNNPRPFCYAYVIPGEWYPVSGGLLRSKDGRSLAGLTFRAPREIERMAGATVIERGRNAAVAQLERDMHQALTDVALKPFESARPGTWQLTAGPIRARDGRQFPFPLYVLVDLSPHTVAEVNVSGTADDEGLARRIVESLRTTTEPACYIADLEALHRATEPPPRK